MPECDEHGARALVRRSRRRQGERPADRVPDRPRRVRGAEDGLPQDSPPNDGRNWNRSARGSDGPTATTLGAQARAGRRGEQQISVKESRIPVRPAKLARQIRRLGRCIRTEARRERRQGRRLDWIRARRAPRDARRPARCAARRARAVYTRVRDEQRVRAASACQVSADVPVPDLGLSVATPRTGRRPVGQRRMAADRQRPGLPTSDTRCSTTRPWGPSAPCGGRGSTPSSSDRAGYLVLVLHLDDHAGTCLPDASLVHLDARPLVSCRLVRRAQGIRQHPRRLGPRAAVGPRAVNLAVGGATRRSQ